MSLVKYTFKGEIKSKEGQDEDCSTCKNGEPWEDRTYYKDGPHGPDVKEINCVECLTKYKIPKVDFFDFTESYHDPDDFIESVEKQLGEVNEMNLEIAKEREKFGDSGECPGHKFLKSYPFKTYEGEFTIKTCLICKVALIDYKGKTYQDKVDNLVRWVAQKGIEARKANEASEKVKEFADIGKKEDIDLSGLLDDDDEEEVEISFI